MPNIVLKNRSGSPITYSGVSTVVVKDTNSDFVRYGIQASLNAPTISISANTLTITDSANNGNFTDGFDVYVDGVKSASTTNTTFYLTTLAATSGSITVKCYGDGMADSPASTAVSWARVYSITATITNGSASGATTILAGSTATVTVSASTGYTKPASSADFTVSGATISSYDPSTGALVLSNPTADVTVSATCAAATYTVTTSITNGSATGATSITYGSTATVVISADTGYTLPAQSGITVTNASISSYDGTTGTLVLASPTGNVTVSATCQASGGSYPSKGDIITLDGGTTHYRVIDIDANGVAKLLDVSNTTTSAFNTTSTTTTIGTKTCQKYADSTLDGAMTTYYNGLSANVKNAIIAQTITQDCWYWGTSGSPAYQGLYAMEPSCFLPGTEITLADGTKKAVEDITYADRLRVWNFDTGAYDSAEICWLTKEGLKNGHYYELTFSDGTTLKTTGKNSNHKVYNVDDRFFEGVAYIKIGTRVFTENGIVTVTDRKYVEEECYYYNIMTKYRIDCFANGVLTSDRYGNMYPIDEDMKYVKDDRPIRPYSEFEAVGISRYWYDCCRLGEQTETLESTRKYITKCESQMRPLPTE